MDLVDHAQSVRLVRGDRVARHQHLQGLARWQQAWEQCRRATAGGETDHRLRLAEGRVLGRDDEVGTLGYLRAASICNAVDGREDRLTQLAHRVQGAVEFLTLT